MSVVSARMPGVADGLTLSNAMCGMVAMMAATAIGPFESLKLDDRYIAAALLLVASTFFDVVDGVAARRWGGTPLGATLDCLADAISFGIAPIVVLVACIEPDASAADRAVLMVGALAYAVAALIRLADFAADRGLHQGFSGLPTTSAAMGVLALGFLALPPWGLAIGLLALGALMVSPIPYPASARVIAVLLVGWIGGALGIVGILNIRVCSAIALLLIWPIIPMTTRYRSRVTLRHPA